MASAVSTADSQRKELALRRLDILLIHGAAVASSARQPDSSLRPTTAFSSLVFRHPCATLPVSVGLRAGKRLFLADLTTPETCTETHRRTRYEILMQRRRSTPRNRYDSSESPLIANSIGSGDASAASRAVNNTSSRRTSAGIELRERPSHATSSSISRQFHRAVDVAENPYVPPAYHTARAPFEDTPLIMKPLVSAVQAWSWCVSFTICSGHLGSKLPGSKPSAPNRVLMTGPLC